MRWLTRSEAAARLEGRTVAVVGSGPGVMTNRRGSIDACEVVVRVNNYKLAGERTGKRTDVFYSYFGSAIRKTAAELKRDGVTMCMSKIPNAHAIESEWHRQRGQMVGVDFRAHFERRAGWWFCDTYVPTVDEFLVGFELLGRRMPTTGFAAILDVLSFGPKSVLITGFDFFRSKVHNLNERWKPRNMDDPIGHAPERELAWLQQNWRRHPIVCDPALEQLLR